jgi:hypothetical protein
LDSSLVRAGVNYRFNWDVPVAVAK